MRMEGRIMMIASEKEGYDENGRNNHDDYQ